MENSLFLAQILGPIYLIVGLGMSVNRKYYDKVYKSFLEDKVLMYVGGLMALILGLLIISIHNVWVSEWAVLITIIGWIGLAKGVMLLVFPEVMKKQSKVWLQGNMMQMATVVALVIGVFLSYFGYLQ